MKYFKLFESFLNEANDLSYWKDYAEGHQQSPKWMNDEAKTVSAVVALIDKCIKNWNQEVEEKGNERIFIILILNDIIHNLEQI